MLEPGADQFSIRGRSKLRTTSSQRRYIRILNKLEMNVAVSMRDV